MEASALHVPAAPVGRLSLAGPLLRLRSDEQLVGLLRAGDDDAFRVLHDRYRQRLFAYVRQMLPDSSRQDAEDVLQDVFIRAYGSLRGDSRQINVKAWLYRVAHNRCIDHLRRPAPVPAELFEASLKPLHDPLEEAQRRDDLRRLVADVSRLPTQQRSALLMRELEGLSYQQLAAALDVTVPAVKSLLVRARIGLVEAAEARDTDCCEIRRDLLAAYDRGVKASGRARRHMRECTGCEEYRSALRGVRRSFTALMPGGAGSGAVLAKLLGLGGAGGGAAAGSAVTAGGGAAGTALAGATACKVAAMVCTAAIAGSAVEVTRIAQQAPDPARSERVAKPGPVAPAPPRAATPLHASAGPETGAAAQATRASSSAASGVRPRRTPAPAPAAPVPAAAPVADEPAEPVLDPVTGSDSDGAEGVHTGTPGDPLGEDAFDGGVQAPTEPSAVSHSPGTGQAPEPAVTHAPGPGTHPTVTADAAPASGAAAPLADAAASGDAPTAASSAPVTGPNGR